MKPQMGSPWQAWQQNVRDVAKTVVTRAKNPSERVARHWESTTELTWFGAGADHSQLHVSWSFGKLRGVEGARRETVGVFHVTRAAFPDVDDAALRAGLEALIPVGTDGATKVFLMRVAAQLAVGDALLALAPAKDLTLFARPDALETSAPTPRWPEHARERVTLALAGMSADFSAKVEAVFLSPHAALLDALRG